MTEIYEARDFAIKAHGDQKYGDQPYGVHLFDVAGIVRDFGLDDRYRKAAFLHDVLEDTAVTLDELVEKFGVDVASLVLACTGEGLNRKTRNASIYRKIAALPPAAAIKLADRIANVENSEPGSGHRLMYTKEQEAFAAAIRPYVNAEWWDRLERAFK